MQTSNFNTYILTLDEKRQSESSSTEKKPVGIGWYLEIAYREFCEFKNSYEFTSISECQRSLNIYCGIVDDYN